MPVNGGIIEEHLSSAAETDKDDLEILHGVVRSMPREPLKDLLSNGVCARCIFRLFSLSEEILSRPTLATRILTATLDELTESDEDGAISGRKEARDPTDIDCVRELQVEFKVCGVCLGVLQFVYSDDNGVLVKKNHASDFAAVVGDAVKQEGHHIDSFCLEVSLPSTIVENEQAVWKYINMKYGSESWFKEKFLSESIGVKDFLKLSVTKSLEKLLDIQSSESTFRVRLTYTSSDASSKDQTIHESNGCSKRRKTDDNDVFKNSAGLHNVHELSRNSCFEQQHDGNGFSTFPLEKANQFCSLTFQCYKTSVYVGGRYLKYSRNVSQTRWIIDDERMGEASIEEIVGGNILPICKGDNYKFHAAGREDIDVRMLGTGRPFLVEIQNARLFASDTLIRNMEMKINTLESKFVRVKNLKFLGSQGWDLMREGEAEKQKQYAALVWISRPLDNDDVQTLSSLKDLQIVQKTPIRVLHRRSPLGREKTIHWMRVERIAGSSQYFLLHLCTQAGTYIKEFVHGDLGRTHPSVGSILGCRSEILRLDVTDVKMDCFNA